MSVIINIFNNSNIRKSLPKKKLVSVLKNLFSAENYNVATLNIIFVDNDEIHQINKEYLNHDYPTDVISFCLEEEPLEGEIYISAEMAKTNATEYHVTWTKELMRYAIHGALHIVGYDDATVADKEKMTKLEDKYIAIIMI